MLHICYDIVSGVVGIAWLCGSGWLVGRVAVCVLDVCGVPRSDGDAARAIAGAGVRGGPRGAVAGARGGPRGRAGPLPARGSAR